MSLACVQSQSCELKTLRQVEWGFQVCVSMCVLKVQRSDFISELQKHFLLPYYPTFSCLFQDNYSLLSEQALVFRPFLNCVFHLSACLSICPSWQLPVGSLTVHNCLSHFCYPSWVSVFMPMSVLSSLSWAHSYFLHQWNHWAANKPILTRKSKFTPTPPSLMRERVQK